jgi:hypothetical protein
MASDQGDLIQGEMVFSGEKEASLESMRMDEEGFRRRYLSGSEAEIKVVGAG